MCHYALNWCDKLRFCILCIQATSNKNNAFKILLVTVQLCVHYCYYMGTAIEHPVPDRVCNFLTSGHSDAQG